MQTRYITDLPDAWLPIARVFSALGDGTRQKILLLFEPEEELSIKDIVAVFPLSRTAVVHHLLVLERAGVLAARRKGKAALYRLREEAVLEAMEQLRAYIAQTFSGKTGEGREP